MSASPRPNLMLRIRRDLRAFDASLDQLDEAVAARLAIGRSDLRAMELVSRHGRLGPAALAKRLALTTGAVTTLVDRLESNGLLRREPDPEDRRRVVLRVTKEGATRERELFGQLGLEVARWLSRRPTRDLEAIADFLDAARSLADSARARIEGGR